MKQCFILILIIVSFSSCNITYNSNQDFFIIYGELENTQNEQIYLSMETAEKIISIDSAIIDESGKFKLQYNPDEKGLYIIRSRSSNAIYFCLDKEDTVKLTGDLNNLAMTYNTEGSKDSKILQLLNQNRIKSFIIADSLLKQLNNNQHRDDYLLYKNKIDSLLQEVFINEKSFVKNILNNNLNSLASLYGFFIYQSYGRQSLFNEEERYSYYEKIDSALMPSFPQNTDVLDIQNRLLQLKQIKLEKKIAEEKLKTGAIAPEIVLNDTAGKPLPLSSLKGKIVLLNFWTTVCAPCRQDHQKLEKIYKKYKPKGFEIYSVFFGNNLKYWKGAVKLDNITWIQVSDLKLNSPILELYNLPKNIHYYYLLDTDNKIINKGFTVDELEDILDNLLN